MRGLTKREKELGMYINAEGRHCRMATPFDEKFSETMNMIAKKAIMLFLQYKSQRMIPLQATPAPSISECARILANKRWGK